MLLTITTTHQPATDLGYLLHKHPDKCQEFSLSFGKAHVFYPEATEEKTTAALLLDINPIELVRGRGKGRGEQTIAHYVNDRPYAASSFMSVAISNVFGTALSGKCKSHPELVTEAISLIAKLPVLPSRGGEGFLRQLFEPLGYKVTAETIALGDTFPHERSPYFAVTLSQTISLADMLSHLYVLIPVLDDDKHYWVGEEEIEKLLRHGEGWLNNHPAKEAITSRYLKRRRRLSRIALSQLADDATDTEDEAAQAAEEAAIEKPLSLNQQRLETVSGVIKEHGITSAIDLGCGEGKLLRYLVQNKSLNKIAGVDVSYSCLETARKRLKLDNLPFHQQDRIELFQSSLIYRDKRFSGYDAATLIEVMEHLDLNRLAALERVVFEYAKLKLVIVTTPNIEYNVRFESLPTGKLRHRDHRFEWTRKEFQTWANDVAERFNYGVKFQGIGDVDPDVGTPTQMAVFTLSI